MSVADEVVADLCERYAGAVSANDSLAYSRLFAGDAIRIPPGADPEHGPEEIRRGEQADYDVATWTVTSKPLDALEIVDGWIYGVARADVSTTRRDTGETSHFQATKTWLLRREPTGEWLIVRQMWNRK